MSQKNYSTATNTNYHGGYSRENSTSNSTTHTNNHYQQNNQINSASNSQHNHVARHNRNNNYQTSELPLQPNRAPENEPSLQQDQQPHLHQHQQQHPHQHQQHRLHSSHAPQFQNQLQHHHHHHLNQTAGLSHNGNSYIRSSMQQDGDGFPLRILVQSDMVGAIIGRCGSAIKQITQQSKAKIDIHRDESPDQQEKVITICGSPESCSMACFKILDIILNERMQNKSKTGSDLNLNNSQCSANETDQVYSVEAAEVQLRILAHNNLIGRLIGKNGASIKKIMEQTSTKIDVSVNNVSDSTQGRIINVVGSLEQVRQAEQIISSKLRTAYMSDMNIHVNLQAINPQSYLFNNIPISYMPGPYAQNPILSSLAGHGGHHHTMQVRPMSMGSHQASLTGAPIYPNYPGYIPFYLNSSIPQAGHGLLGFNPLGGRDLEKETVHIYIANTMVGAIIGKSGSAIKEMISTSGASIKVASAPVQSETNPEPKIQQQDKNSSSDLLPESDDSVSACHSTQQDKSQVTVNSHQTSRQNSSDFNVAVRKVTIVGTPESQWSAQYLIYRKVSIESKKSDISLMVEIQVPSNLVGRIIGKNGNTVKQIQKHTRTTIKLPDEKPNLSCIEDDSETSVHIIGEFHCSQLAQRQIRYLIRDSSSLSRQNKQHSKINESSEGKSSAQENFIE